MRKSTFGLIAAILAVVALVRWQSLAFDTTTQAAGSVVVPIVAVGSSGQTGSATLTSTPDNKTQVVIALNNTPAGAQEPAHIHMGTCKKLNPKPAYPLTTVASGASTTTVDVPLSTLQAGGFAINVHASTSNLSTYVACGDIPATTAPAPQPMST